MHLFRNNIRSDMIKDLDTLFYLIPECLSSNDIKFQRKEI